MKTLQASTALFLTITGFFVCFWLMDRLQGQVISHAMNGSASHQQRPLSPPSYPAPPTLLRTGLHRKSRSSGELSIFFLYFTLSIHKYLKRSMYISTWNHFVVVVLCLEGSESITRESVVSGLTSISSAVPIARFSEEEKRVSVIKAPHYEGIGPVDESGIPIAIRTVSYLEKMSPEPGWFLSHSCPDHPGWLF